MAEFESLCPKCGEFDYHILKEQVPGYFNIPPRDVLECSHCGQIFYRVVTK